MTQNQPELTADSVDGLQIALQGGQILRVGPAVLLYHARPRDVAGVEQLVATLDRFLALAGRAVTHISFGVENDRPLAQDELLDLGNRIRAENPALGLTLRLHGGATPEAADPVFFSCLLPASWAPEPLSHVSAGVSMQVLMGAGTSLVEWTQSLCAAFEPAHGSGGFTLLANALWAYGSEVTGQIAAVLERFAGLDHPAVPTGGFVTRAGPVAANWLTVLDNALLSAMGGAAAVAQAMRDLDGHSAAWPGGMVIVAPGGPQVGGPDVALRAYKQVGSLITALRGAPDAVYFSDAIDRDMLAFGKAWRARFDAP